MEEKEPVGESACEKVQEFMITHLINDVDNTVVSQDVGINDMCPIDVVFSIIHRDSEGGICQGGERETVVETWQVSQEIWNNVRVYQGLDLCRCTTRCADCSEGRVCRDEDSDAVHIVDNGSQIGLIQKTQESSEISVGDCRRDKHWNSEVPMSRQLCSDDAWTRPTHW